jgi:putative ABC transport system permease protein
VSRSISLAAYRAALRLVPGDLRDAHGGEMEALFLAELDNARARGRTSAAHVWLRAIADVVRRAPYEHWRRRRARRSPEKRMQSFVSDLRFAVRSFRRQPGATALVVVTLALAVAANTAVFSLVDAVFFRALPYPDASRLVDVNETAPKWNLDFTGINYADFVQWQKSSHAFEGMALWDDERFNVASGDSPERLDGQAVTYNMLSVMGLRPALGRSFTREEDVPKGPNVAMIGYALWQTRFAGRSNVLGTTMDIDGAPYTIVGVLPRDVVLGGPAALWIPLRGEAVSRGASYSYEGIGRLKPSITMEQARRDLAMAQEPIWRTRDTARVVSPRVMSLQEKFVIDYRTIGGALGAGVALVLLIACANVSGAMLARAIGRRREMGIRVALGASGSRLTRQLMTEALALSAIGCVIGTIVGRQGVHLLTLGIASPPPWLHLSVDLRAVGFSVLLVIVAAMLFGLVPSLQARRSDPGGALSLGGHRTAGSLPERRMLHGLVVVEVALAAVLLAAGGLLLRAYFNLRDTDPGFRPDGVATFAIALPDAKYRDGRDDRRFYATLIDRIRALPGVTDAGAVTCPPFTCHQGSFFMAEGAAPTHTNQMDPVVLLRLASGGYFQTMGIKLIEGRFYDDREGAPNGPRPAVINDLLAKRLWPDGSSPIGKRFTYRGDTAARDWMTVVGVVKDVRHYGLTEPMRPGLYLSMTSLDSSYREPNFVIAAHTSGDPSTVFPAMRAAVRELDPGLPMYGVKTMHTALEQSLAPRRALATWLVAFSAIALVLATSGIYAVLSYVVGRRRQEIGIRMALGARDAQVLRLVVRQGVTLVGIGLVIGVPAAFGAARLLSSMLVGIGAGDPPTYLLVIALLLATGACAAAIPARRAARVDPKIALNDAGG